MKSLKLFITLLLLFGVLSCSSPAKNIGGADGQTIILKGKVIHNRSNKHALNKEFISTPEAHLVIDIVYNEFADGPYEPVFEQDFKSIKKLPFEFEIRINKNDILSEERRLGNYIIGAKLLYGTGTEAYVGDLTSEISHEVFQSREELKKNMTDYVEIEVFGLEDCDAANSGGFCTSQYRETKK